MRVEGGQVYGLQSWRPLAGKWNIAQTLHLLIARLARLDVNAPHWHDGRQKGGLDIRGTNVKRIDIISSSGPVASLDGLGQVIHVRYRISGSDLGTANVQHRALAPARVYGPMIRLLCTPGPLTFVVGSSQLHLEIAKNLAHDVFVNHRLDSEIVEAQEVLIRIARQDVVGNIVIIGDPRENVVADWLVRQKRLPSEAYCAT